MATFADIINSKKKKTNKTFADVIDTKTVEGVFKPIEVVEPTRVPITDVTTEQDRFERSFPVQPVAPPKTEMPLTTGRTIPRSRTDRQGVSRIRETERRATTDLAGAKVKDDARKKALQGAEERLANLIEESKRIDDSPEPDALEQNRITREILETRNIITANQPGFKSGVREAFGFEPTAKFGAQLATPERTEAKEEALETARTQSGFGTGRVVGELGKQAALYATVGAALKGTELGRALSSTLSSKLGKAGTFLGGKLSPKAATTLGSFGTKAGAFTSEQLVDLFVDTVIQTPQELLRGDTIGEIGWARLFDVGMNLGIGAGGEFIKALKKADNVGFTQAIKEITPEQARGLMKFDLQMFSAAEQAEIARKAAKAATEVPLSPVVKEAPEAIAKAEVGPTRAVAKEGPVRRPRTFAEVIDRPVKVDRMVIEPTNIGKNIDADGEIYKIISEEGNNYKVIDPMGNEGVLPKAYLDSVGKEVDDVVVRANELLAESSMSMKGESFTEGRLKSDLLDSGLQRGETGDFTPSLGRVQSKDIKDLLDRNFASSEGVLRNRLERIAEGRTNIGDQPLKEYLEESIQPVKAVDDATPTKTKKTLLEKLGLVESVDDMESFKLDVDRPVSIAADIEQPKADTLRIPVDEAKRGDGLYTTPDTVEEIVEQGLKWKESAPKKYNELFNTIGDAKVNDIGTFRKWTKDVYRNLEQAFGDNFNKVKENVLDPFDASKKAKVEDEIAITNRLKKEVVDKLGIDKGKKKSKFVQRYGEGNISLDDLKKEMPNDWKNIVEADKWFRKEYDQLLDQVNDSLVAMGKDPVPKRKDYYRHFQEMGSTWEGIRNTFKDSQLISPELVGLSEYTKPTTKWASFKQKRGLGEYKEDAIGGFLNYLPAATYAKHIDPHIGKFRNLRNYLATTATENDKGLANVLEYLDEYSNTLAGKTGFVDRSIQKLIGRKAMNTTNLLNSRMKANAVLGNASSSMAQIANVPQGIADVKNPVHIASGLANYFKSLGGGGDKALYEQSGFLKERLTDSYSQFDSKIMDQPKKLAAWLLGVGDEVGTKAIWSMEYRKALAEGVQNPVKYADDITRKLVAGRGIGEMPELQRQKAFQLIAPFTLEVGNLWNVQKDFLNDRDFAGLAILYASNFLLNEGMEDIRGSRVVFDPIQAIKEGLEESEGESFMDRAGSIAGNLGGEILGNIPLGSSIGSVYPEYGGEVFGVDLPTREQLFGENDPTRFGTQLPLARAVQKPLSSFALPFGGQQVRKTVEGGQALGVLPKLTEEGFKLDDIAKSKKGKLITPTLKTPESVSKGLLFGKYAIPEVQEFYDEDGKLFSEKQTANFEELVDNQGFNPQTLFKALTETRAYDKAEKIAPLLKERGIGDILTDPRELSRAKADIKRISKRAEIVKILEKYYNDSEINKILETFYDYKTRR